MWALYVFGFVAIGGIATVVMCSLIVASDADDRIEEFFAPREEEQ